MLNREEEEEGEGQMDTFSSVSHTCLQFVGNFIE